MNLKFTNLKLTVKMIFVLFIYCSSSGAQTQETNPSTFWPQTFWHSLMTNLSLKREAYDQSFQHAIKALESEPLSPQLQINLGNSFEGLGSLSKARDAYAASEKLSSDPVIHFQSRFNQAQALAKEKKVDEALEMYQKALEIDPQSQIVKTNIELLLSSSGGKGGKGDKDKENQDDENEGEGGDQDKKNDENPKKFAENKPQQGKKQPQDLSQGDIKKILEELKQQEQKIRGDFYKQSNNEQKQKGKEGKREKDW